MDSLSFYFCVLRWNQALISCTTVLPFGSAMRNAHQFLQSQLVPHKEQTLSTSIVIMTQVDYYQLSIIINCYLLRLLTWVLLTHSHTQSTLYKMNVQLLFGPLYSCANPQILSSVISLFSEQPSTVLPTGHAFLSHMLKVQEFLQLQVTCHQPYALFASWKLFLWPPSSQFCQPVGCSGFSAHLK
jgi:hypothetical protein